MVIQSIRVGEKCERGERVIKRLYFYDPIGGAYLGSAPQFALQEESTFPATELPPPSESQDGYPYFINGEWQLNSYPLEESFWRQEWWHLHYYNRTKLLKPYQPAPILATDFPPYPNPIAGVAVEVVVVTIVEKIRVIQQRYLAIEQLYQRIWQAYQEGRGERFQLYRYRLRVEEWIMAMRHIVDTLVQLSYILTHSDRLQREPHIKYNEVGKFLNLERVEDSIARIIIGDPPSAPPKPLKEQASKGVWFAFDPNSVWVHRRIPHYKKGKLRRIWEKRRRSGAGWLDLINSLSNSFKHSLLGEGLYGIPLTDATPHIGGRFVRFNRFLNPVINHHHPLKPILLGFEENVQRILYNQHLYLRALDD